MRKTEKKKCVARCRARHGRSWDVFRHELETLKGQVARMARELLQLEDAVGRLHRTGEALQAQVAATEKKVEQLIQGQVMDCAEAKESYRRFVLGFLAFLDLLEEKLRLHRASAVRREMLARLLEVLDGRLPAGQFGEYLGDLGERTDAAGAFHEKWHRTMAELAGRFYLVNLRGRTHLLRDNGAALSAALRKMEIDLAIFDPRYSLLQAGEDENKGDGIRGILDFRNDLITRAGCAVLMVGHDPKGDTAGKPIADRGAGSYWAGADYDFALALSPHETDGAEVLSASSRYRKSPADLTVLFDGETLTFSADPDTPALAKNAKPPTSAKDRADRLAAKQAALEKTVRELVADGTLRTMSEFRLAVAQTEAGAALGENIRRQMLDGFISKGGDWIMTTPQLIKKPNGDVGKVKHGTIIVGSSEAITNYLQQFGSQPT